MEKPIFPMRINKYLALKKYSTRRGADEIIKKNQVFINGKIAVLGAKVEASDVIEVKLKGKPIPLVYIAYNKPRGENVIKQAASPGDIFPVGTLDKDAHGLIILTNDGRVTDRLLSPAYIHEKEYIGITKNNLRSSFKLKMEAGVKIENDRTQKCMVKILDKDTFRILLTDEKKHQVRRMCMALFQEVKDLQCIRIMNIQLGNLKQGTRRNIEGEELKGFLSALDLI